MSCMIAMGLLEEGGRDCHLWKSMCDVYNNIKSLLHTSLTGWKLSVANATDRRSCRVKLSTSTFVNFSSVSYCISLFGLDVLMTHVLFLVRFVNFADIINRLMIGKSYNPIFVPLWCAIVALKTAWAPLYIKIINGIQMGLYTGNNQQLLLSG